MKISTVLAAAFAAGLTTFAANAQELGYQPVSLGYVRAAGFDGDRCESR